MLRAIILAAIILFPGIASSRQDTLCAKTAVFQHKLPQKNVSVLKTMYGTGGLNFLVLHHDENTGLQINHEEHYIDKQTNEVKWNLQPKSQSATKAMSSLACWELTAISPK